MKKVLATALYPTWDVHFIAELEMVERHLDDGDEVTLLTCDAHLGSCMPNPRHHLPFCMRCIGMRQHGLRLLGRNVKTLPLLTRHPWNTLPLRTSFSDLEDLKSYRVGNFDIGLAVLSSLVDDTRDTKPDLSKHSALLDILLRDSFDVYHTALSHLRRCRFDVAYIFNGRFSTARALVRACERMKVDYYTHERGGQRFLYDIFRNSLPHEPEPYPSRIRDAWEKEQDVQFREKEAREFYEERRRGDSSSWVSYVSDQDPGRLPEGWDPSRRNVVIFASSEGEMVAVSDFIRPRIYPDQLEGVLHLAELSREDPAIQLYLRVHPNSLHEQRQWWKDSRLSGRAELVVLPPESPVSSYALLDACEKVLCFGSTMGMEATYTGKPSVLLNHAFYQALGAVYEPSNLEQVKQCLLGRLAPKPSKVTLPYGFYCRHSGNQMRYSEPWGLWRVKYKGHALEPRREIQQSVDDLEKRISLQSPPTRREMRSQLRAFRKIWRKYGGDLAVEPLQVQLTKLEIMLQERDATLMERDATLMERDAALMERDAALRERAIELRERAIELRKRDAALRERDAALSGRDAALRERDAMIGGLQCAESDLLKRLEKRDHAIASMKESLSWKMTAPLRKISNRLLDLRSRLLKAVSGRFQ